MAWRSKLKVVVLACVDCHAQIVLLIAICKRRKGIRLIHILNYMMISDIGNIHFIGAGGASMSALAKYSLLQGIKVSGSDSAFSPELKNLYLAGASVFVADYGNTQYDNFIPLKELDKNLDSQSILNDNLDGAINAENCEPQYFLKSIGFLAKFVEKADIVVHSSAINEANPELQLAKNLGKPILERYSFLGEIASEFDKVIAVGGTHGKTTVTAMIAHILKCADVKFTAHIGGNVLGYGNLIVNPATEQRKHLAKESIFQSQKIDAKPRRGIFVTEACEYKRSLLSLSPTLGVVLNAECDHPDCYPDINAINEVLGQFLSQSQNVLVPLDLYSLCPERQGLQKSAHICKSAHMGSEKNGHRETEEGGILLSNYSVYKWRPLNTGADLSAFEFFKNGIKYGDVSLLQGGIYNLSNAAFAVAAAIETGIKFIVAARAVSTFEGVARRYEKIQGKCCKTIIFDYAHHPTQIKNVLENAKKEGKLLVVFQPHTYSRTAKYLDDFVTVLGSCKKLVIMPTYAAREMTKNGVGSDGLLCAIKEKFPLNKIYLTNSHLETADFIKKHAKGCDAVLMLGAGNIYDLKGLL